jgi:TonB family protein
MLDPATSQSPKHRFLTSALAPHQPKQRRLMVAALMLLLISLGIVLYRDRDFWFPDTEDATDQPLQQPLFETAEGPAGAAQQVPTRSAKSHSRAAQPTVVTPVAEDPVQPLTVTRTVLPPLEVEVVAGSAHRRVRPGSNAIKVDLQPGNSAETAQQVAVPESDQPASITVNAAEHAPISPEPTDVVSHSVAPDYPMLARQMKVQGSVVLQALIGRDGLIQDLHVLAGSPILAKAALEAVKQWHFKPHYEGAEAVETQAKITVNFTISTN